jgi:hypothetical protein
MLSLLIVGACTRRDTGERHAPSLQVQADGVAPISNQHIVTGFFDRGDARVQQDFWVAGSFEARN